MTLDSYFLFVSASVILCVIPGPDMVFLLSRSVVQGRRAGLFAAFGINLGAYFHLLAATLGLSAILLTSSIAFSSIKLLGAAYLIYLGVKTLIGKDKSLSSDYEGTDFHSNHGIFWQGFLSDVLNPKVALFFLAFLPQFVVAGSENQVQQIIFLGVTLNVIALVINLILAIFSSRVSLFFNHNSAMTTWLERAMGITFIGLGIRLANEK